MPRQRRQDEADPRPPRLPPGRHGLSREFVARNQRQRLLAATVTVVAERGLRKTTIAAICARAGVSRRVFYANFRSAEACFLAVYDEAAVHLAAAAEEAAAGLAAWPEQAAARLRAALELFAADPDLARCCLVAPRRVGGAPVARYREALAEALACLRVGRPAAVREPSAAVAAALIAGLAALVADQVEAGEGEELPRLLPDLVELFLTPYLGRAAAIKAVARAAC